MIGLVGERDHAVATAALNVGAAIRLQLEPDNPQDRSAIAAVDRQGRVIGYIPHDSWLREAIYGGGASFTARVLAAETGTLGFRRSCWRLSRARNHWASGCINARPPFRANCHCNPPIVPQALNGAGSQHGRPPPRSHSVCP
jgi:hypothetical protein